MKPVVIIVPTYNSAATIVETLQSIQDQDDLSTVRYVLLCDDGSTDDTVERARRAWTGSVPLRLRLAERNRGERGNLNDAMTSLEGDIEWALILHSDDLAKPHWTRRTIEEFKGDRDNVASVCSSYDVFQPGGVVESGEDDPHRAPELIRSSRLAVRSTLLRGCWWHISGSAIHIASFRASGGFREDLPQLGDWEWVLRCLRLGYGLVYIPRTLIRYRQHSTSVSSLSFRVHRDVTEALGIIQEYAAALSRADLAKIHARRLTYLARRAVRSLVARDGKRALLAVRVGVSVVVNFFRCQAGVGSTLGSSAGSS